MRQHAALELDVKDLQQRLTDARAQSGANRSAALQAQVDSTEQLLAEARTTATEASARHDTLVAERRDADRQLQALYQKQGAGAQFASQAERDAWLKGEIATLRAALEDSNRAARDAEGRRSALEGELQAIQQVVCISGDDCLEFMMLCLLHSECTSNRRRRRSRQMQAAMRQTLRHARASWNACRSSALHWCRSGVRCFARRGSLPRTHGVAVCGHRLSGCF